MNILLFVFSMLLILSSLTYTSLANFQQSSSLQIEYRRYLAAREEALYWDQALKLYDAQKVSEGRRGQGGSRMLAKLNLKPLLSGEDPAVMREVFIRLIQAAYGDQAFYRAFIEEQNRLHGATEESALYQLVDSLRELEVTSDAKLAQAPIEDPSLRNFLVKLINGRAVPKNEQGGYPALTTLATVSGQRKTSLYLAPREVLLAILEDERVVEDLMVRRMELYSAMDREELTVADGRREWKDFVEGRLFTLPDTQYVDFGVSLTRPKN